MAQPGNFTPILLYASSTLTNVPSAGNLTNSATGSEIAINIADKNLFFKDSGGVVNTVPIRQSSTSSNGWLSATDWNTFNNKQPAGTYVTSVGATSPITSSGGTTPTIAMPAATTSVSGYLTSTDWNTFNNKQTALVSGTNIKTVGGASLLGSGDVTTLAGDITLSTGNLIIGTSGKGIDFSATPGTGTSELLADYEEGTWTTTVSDTSNFTGTPTLSNGKYTKVGRLVTIEGKFSGTVTVANVTTYFKFTLPFSRSATTDGGAGFVFTSSTFQSGGIYNVLADTTTAYVVYAPPALLPLGSNTFFFSYSYYT